MTSSHPYPEDLIARSRRGDLPDQEQRALRRVLASSHDARVLYDVGLGFDAESPVLPGDEEFLERLAERVGPVPSQRKRTPWWKIALPAAAAGCFVAATAAASGWIMLRPRPPAGSAASSVPQRASGSAHPMRRYSQASARFSADDSAPAHGVSSSAPRHGIAHVASRGPVRPSASLPQAESSAPATPERPDVLFVRANGARRAGRTSEAMALYQRLVSEHGATAEAQQAELSLGELYLRGGDPSAALSHFRRYVGQPLRAEALWGQARALRQLDSIAQEREVLLMLCEQLPTSPYAEPARKRLGTLAE
ncbi:MAG: tetratricopeptide repeat protein [Polyangiaceae bacterium]|nr:tetratricopeptide repeat protein [Polyangiaceae bacterium]